MLSIAGLEFLAERSEQDMYHAEREGRNILILRALLIIEHVEDGRPHSQRS